MTRRALIVGGFGFVGSNLVRLWREEHPRDKILVVDSLEATADLRNLVGTDGYDHAHVDVRDAEAVFDTVEAFDPECVINCGSSFHFEDYPQVSRDFYETDVVGTLNLLEACREVWGSRKDRRFLQVSTDEVFGLLADDAAPFDESDRPDPRSAYATAKSAADQIVLAHFAAHGMDVVITHGSSTYGPNQKDSFLIPFTLRAAFNGTVLTIPDSSTVRDWIYVDDHCWGIMQCFEMGRAGARYCLSGNAERSNGDVVEMTLAIFERAISQMVATDFRIGSPQVYLKDEVTPDRRVISSETARNEFGWEPDFPFEVALESTVQWYLNRFLSDCGFH